MKKGEESKQRLIKCAAELFWSNGYTATGLSEILKEAKLPKGSFYFHFKNKDELGVAVLDYYHHIVYEKFQILSEGKTWEEFIPAIFDYLLEQIEMHGGRGCPFAVMGMETAFQKPEIAREYHKALQKHQEIFCKVLCQSGIVLEHAKILSQRELFIYQGAVLLGRIGNDITYINMLREHMIDEYREYCAFHNCLIEKI